MTQINKLESMQQIMSEKTHYNLEDFFSTLDSDDHYNAITKGPGMYKKSLIRTRLHQIASQFETIVRSLGKEHYREVATLSELFTERERLRKRIRADLVKLKTVDGKIFDLGGAIQTELSMKGDPVEDAERVLLGNRDYKAI